MINAQTEILVTNVEKISEFMQKKEDSIAINVQKDVALVLNLKIIVKVVKLVTFRNKINVLHVLEVVMNVQIS